MIDELLAENKSEEDYIEGEDGLRQMYWLITKTIRKKNYLKGQDKWESEEQRNDRVVMCYETWKIKFER